jgi:phosphotriesterase-related protein
VKTRRDVLRSAAALPAALSLPTPSAAAEAKTIPSVLGELAPSQLGMTLPHEHVAALYDWRRVAHPGPGPDDLKEEYRTEQHQSLLAFWDLLGAELKRNGVQSILDARTEHSGRDVPSLQEISRRTKLNIMCTTGYYVGSRRPPDFVNAGPDASRDYMVKELTDGIGTTGVRPAAIKIALGGRAGNASDDVLLAATGRAQKEAGCAITTHATTPESRKNMLDILEKNGADLSRVAIGHADSNGTAEEHIELLKRAGYVLYTIWGITNPKLIGTTTPPAPDHSGRLIRRLLDHGLVDKVMFSIDFSIYPHQGGIVLRLYDIPERTSNYIFTFVLPQLRELGVSEIDVRRMMVDNPRRHLCGA